MQVRKISVCRDEKIPINETDKREFVEENMLTIKRAKMEDAE